MREPLRVSSGDEHQALWIAAALQKGHRVVAIEPRVLFLKPGGSRPGRQRATVHEVLVCGRETLAVLAADRELPGGEAHSCALRQGHDAVLADQRADALLGHAEDRGDVSRLEQTAEAGLPGLIGDGQQSSATNGLAVRCRISQERAKLVGEDVAGCTERVGRLLVDGSRHLFDLVELVANRIHLGAHVGSSIDLEGPSPGPGGCRGSLGGLAWRSPGAGTSGAGAPLGHGHARTTARAEGDSDHPPHGHRALRCLACPPWFGRSSVDGHDNKYTQNVNLVNDARTIRRVRARFPVDDERVHVMGFSGGSGVAEIVALAYPDIFRGAVLNAGDDPIDGQEGIYKPPADLFRVFQHSRIVYITGDQDEENVRQDDVSRASMRAACVLDVKTVVALRIGQQPLDAPSLDRALDALEEPRAVDPAEIARCDARVEREISAELRKAAAAIARGDRTGARHLIDALDARFGGLAAPRILALEAQLAAQE